MGFKSVNNTEHWEVPSGWAISRIEDLCIKVTSGSTPKAGSPEYYGGSINWFRTGELKDGFLYNSELKITEKALKETSVKLYPINTVLMAMYGDGKTITSLGILKSESTTNQACCAMIVNPEICDYRFLFYSLKNHKDDFINLANGGGQRNLSVSVIKNFAIRLPPLENQQKISGILTFLDEKIEINQRMNHTLEAMARALFKSWFVDFDPVKANAEGRRMEGISPEVQALFPSEFEDSPLGPVPLGWEVKSLDQISNFLNGLALQKFPPTGNGDLPVIKIAQLRKGFTDDSEYAGNYIDKKYIITNGDVLFSWSGSLEVKIWTGGLGALNQHLFKVTSERFPKWFYYLWVLNYLPWFREIASSKATTMGHIQRHHLADAKVLVPNDSLLDSMSNVFGPLFDMLISRHLEIKQLEVIRDTLLPKLLSGELDVSQLSNLVSTD